MTGRAGMAEVLAAFGKVDTVLQATEMEFFLQSYVLLFLCTDVIHLTGSGTGWWWLGYRQ